jgi:hypothetical protein
MLNSSDEAIVAYRYGCCDLALVHHDRLARNQPQQFPKLRFTGFSQLHYQSNFGEVIILNQRAIRSVP